MNTTLRLARAGDYAVIASWISDAASCARWAGPQLAYPFDIRALPHLLEKPGSNAMVLTDATDATLGFAQYWQRDAQRVHLGRIIVSPSSRGLGYGRILCEGLLSTALSHTGRSIASLRVYRDNPAAQNLYRQMGFVEVASDSDQNVLAMEYRLHQ